MKKVSILVRAADVKSALKDLRSLGVLHIEHQRLPEGKDIGLLQEDIVLISEALNVLFENPPLKITSGVKRLAENSKDIAARILGLRKKRIELDEHSRTLKAKISQWQAWGDFNPQIIEELRGKGIFVKLYRIPLNQTKHFPQNVVVKKVAVSAGLASIAVISRRDFSLEAKELELPLMSLKEMQEVLAFNAAENLALEEQLGKLSIYFTTLKEDVQSLEKELEFQQALNGMGGQGEISYVCGYAPFDTASILLDNSHKYGWGILISEPLDDDPVPTLIRTPRWISTIKPVFKLLGIVPGYRELDVSPLFLVFFSLFFGILIGDAGYGLVYLLLTAWLQKKIGAKTKDKTVFHLFYVLSFCAILWGLFTASFFGQGWCAKLGLKPLIPALNNSKNMQRFCFFVGALHLSIAHVWRAALKIPSLTALVDLGWICVLWSAFFFAKMLILGDALPGYTIWILYIGMALVVLFTNPQRNILKGIGEGLGTLALSLMNNFTDVVSYVRLFAVGMAGLAIAETSNAMTAGIGRNTLLSFIAGTLIIVVGHSLNIILGPISVLVHGVRLNVLEFSGHASISWSGEAYKPFQE